MKNLKNKMNKLVNAKAKFQDELRDYIGSRINKIKDLSQEKDMKVHLVTDMKAQNVLSIQFKVNGSVYQTHSELEVEINEALKLSKEYLEDVKSALAAHVDVLTYIQHHQKLAS